jgi:hypothetical protein
MHDQITIEVGYGRFEIFLDEILGGRIHAGAFTAKVAHQPDVMDALGVFDNEQDQAAGLRKIVSRFLMKSFRMAIYAKKGMDRRGSKQGLFRRFESASTEFSSAHTAGYLNKAVALLGFVQSGLVRQRVA